MLLSDGQQNVHFSSDSDARLGWKGSGVMKGPILMLNPMFALSFPYLSAQPDFW